jgi:hypothetical protein
MSLIVDGTTGVTFNDSSLQGAAASPFGLKNRIINGDMVIFQRGTAATTDLTYSVDRWRLVKSNDASESVSQNTDAPTGFSYSLRNTISTGDASIGSTQYSGLEQAIEGYNVADLAWGTANAKTVTLSFWVRSSVIGTYTGNLRNSNDTRINPFNFTINVANTWEQKTITITGDTGGTWQTTTSTGIIFAVYAALGSSYTGGTSGTWGTTPAFGCGSPVNGIASNGNIFAISGVQLEIGTSATPFERRMYGNELNLCKRYYEKSYDYSVVPGTTTNVGRWNAGGTDTGRTTGRISGGHVVFQVEKRAIPTVTSYDPVGNSGKCARFTLGTADNANQGVFIADIATNGWFPFADPTGTNDSGCGVHWVASAEL